jgi:CubicO group peptidase (beta-lactamase class C family)
MKTLCRPLSVLLAATLALMSACAVPVSLPPPAAAPTSPPVVKQLETLAPTAVPQPAVAPVVAPTAAPPVLAPTAVPPSAAPAAPPKLAEPQPLIAPDQMRFEGKVDIGGRSLFLSCAGKGEPTIIVDDIMGRNGSNFIAPYQPELSQISRVCFVSRPNTIDSQSDSVKEMRTITDLVSDLRAVLQKAGLKPPYVLAGGEFGAMNMTLFAAQYPKEVVGLALVQPWRPGTTSAFLDLVPAASATSDKAKQFRAFWEGMLVGKYKDPSIELDTRIDIVASEKLLLGVKSLGDMPVYVLRGAPQAWALAPEPAIAAQMNKIYDERLGFYTSLSNRVELTEGRFVDKAPFLAAVQKLVDAARAQKANEQAAAVLKIADSYVGPLADQDKFGGSVLIAQEGKVLLNKGYGYADRDKKTAFAPDSQFLIPLVQPWPAAAVMLLQAQSEGKFSLDDSVCIFITPCLERYKPITLRNLLANTAGVPDVRYDKDVDAALNGVWFSLLNYHGLPDAKFGKPGDRFTTGTIANGVTVKADLGNWAWTYLAGTAALNLNKDLGGVYKDRIKNPLGLGSYGLLGYENDGKLVALYDGAKPAPYSRSLHTGAALMSAADLNTFVQALFDGRLLKPDQLAEMLKPTVKVDTMPGDMYAALGAYVGMDPAGNNLIAGTEVHQGFGAYWAYYPDSKLTVIVMNNLTDWANQPYRARDVGLLLARVILAAK